jgi:hypothetical protein
LTSARVYSGAALLLAHSVFGCEALREDPRRGRELGELRGELVAQGKLIAELRQQRDARLKVNWVSIGVGLTGNEYEPPRGPEPVAPTDENAGQ